MTSPDTIRTAALAAELRQSSIFGGLAESELLQIAGYAERIQLAKGETLFREGDPVIGFYVVLRGSIKAYRINAAGKEQVIHLIHAGGSFAEPAVAGLPGYPAHTCALEPTEVVLIRGPEFLNHLKINSELALRMLASLSRHLHELVHTIESYRLRDAETRLLHWLMRHSESADAPHQFELSTSKAVLASELGTRQETLSRLFATFRRAGILRMSGRSITIADPAGLRRMFEASLQPRERELG